MARFVNNWATEEIAKMYHQGRRKYVAGRGALAAQRRRNRRLGIRFGDNDDEIPRPQLHTGGIDSGLVAPQCSLSGSANGGSSSKL